MWQYIVVALIGLLTFGYLGYKVYKMIFPNMPEDGGCSGCNCTCGH